MAIFFRFTIQYLMRQIAVNGDLSTHGTTQRDHPLIDDAVINLDALATTSQNLALNKVFKCCDILGCVVSISSSN